MAKTHVTKRKNRPGTALYATTVVVTLGAFTFSLIAAESALLTQLTPLAKAQTASGTLQRKAAQIKLSLLGEQNKVNTLRQQFLQALTQDERDQSTVQSTNAQLERSNLPPVPTTAPPPQVAGYTTPSQNEQISPQPSFFAPPVQGMTGAS